MGSKSTSAINSRHTRSWSIWLVVFLCFVLIALEASAEDITDRVQIEQSRLRFDRRENTSMLDATLENISSDNLIGPLRVIISNISPPTVSIIGAAGTTPEGDPYYEYESLTPSQISAVQTWSFLNPDRARFSYSTTVEGTVESLDTAPVANDITPSAFDEDTESIISLSYSDADSDEATSCSLANLNNITVSTPCSCLAGACSVGVTGTLNYNGAASFTYTVTANGAESNSATATLSILPVDDIIPPTPTPTPTPTPERGSTSVIGTVKFQERPIANARVSLVLLGSRGDYRLWTRTDQSGNYRFDNVSPGEYKITAVKRGAILSSSNLTLGSSEEPELEFDLPVQQTASLPDALYVAWNENLDMVNILELANKGQQTLELEISLWESNIEGHSTRAKHKAVRLSIPIESKLDIPLSQLAGESYGKQGIIYIQSNHGFLEGGLSTYRPSSLGTEGFDFSFHTPLSPALLGASFVLYNTYHPALTTSVNHVYNWLSLVNIASTSVRFRLLYYDIGGELLNTRIVRIPGHGRVDVDGGHEIAGPNSAGIVEIQPFDKSAPYNATMVRYAPGALESDFAYAASQNASIGYSNPRYSLITQHPNSRTFLEAANVSTRRTEVTITQYNINGELLSSSSIGVKPKGTIHIPLHDAFPEFGVGSIKVEASRDRSLCFHTMIYQYNDDYTEVIEAQAVTPLDGMVPRLSTSYNLYLGMANWLRLLNTSEQTIGISIAFGEHQAESPLTLKAHARVDIPIHELPLDRNSYGLLIIEADTGNALSGEIVRSTYNAGGKLNLLTTIPLR